MKKSRGVGVGIRKNRESLGSHTFLGIVKKVVSDT